MSVTEDSDDPGLRPGLRVDNSESLPMGFQLRALQGATSLNNQKFPSRGTTTKREPISNSEDQLSHLHPKELRRWNVELR